MATVVTVYLSDKMKVIHIRVSFIQMW